MKEIKITQYQCEICNEIYKEEYQARRCEDWPITNETGVKIGDIVLITGGEGTGQLAKVTHKSICSREYGHYAWEQYWHTPKVCADLLNGMGSRILTFDQYEVKRDAD